MYYISMFKPWFLPLSLTLHLITCKWLRQYWIRTNNCFSTFSLDAQAHCCGQLLFSLPNIPSHFPVSQPCIFLWKTTLPQSQTMGFKCPALPAPRYPHDSFHRPGLCDCSGSVCVLSQGGTGYTTPARMKGRGHALPSVVAMLVKWKPGAASDCVCPWLGMCVGQPQTPNAQCNEYRQ